MACLFGLLIFGVILRTGTALADQVSYQSAGISISCNDSVVTSGTTLYNGTYDHVSHSFNFSCSVPANSKLYYVTYTTEYKSPSASDYTRFSGSGSLSCRDAGTYRITVDFSDAQLNINTGGYNYVTQYLSGQAQFYVMINTCDISDSAITGWDVGSPFNYSGRALDLYLSLYHNSGNGSNYISRNTDYVMEYPESINPGTYTLKVTGIGNYTGQKTLTYKIVANLNNATVTGVNTSYVYTGEAITPTAKVRIIMSGGTYTAKKGTDYTVTYSNNTSCGEATLTIKGKNCCSGTIKIRFGIVPKAVTNTKATSPDECTAKITWTPSTGADGYLIERYDSESKCYMRVAWLANQKWSSIEDRSIPLKDANTTYTYRITPFARGGVKSTDSNVRYLTEETDYLESYSNVTENGYTYRKTTYKYYSLYYGASVKVKCKVTSAVTESYKPIYTGCADIDYQAEQICKKVIKSDMTAQEKVKALYQFMVKNCEHDKDYAQHKRVYNYDKNATKAEKYEESIMADIYSGAAGCTFEGIGYRIKNDGNYYTIQTQNKYHTSNYCSTVAGDFGRTVECFSQYAGGCSYLTRMLLVLCQHVGIRGNLVTGNYVNKDKTYTYHEWCYLRVAKKYAWYDISISTKSENNWSTWYKKTDASYWSTCHTWVLAGVPSSLNKNYKMVSGKYSQTHTVSDYADQYKSYVKSYGSHIGSAVNALCIPGLSRTDDLVPQGIAYLEDMDIILISAYDRNGKKPSVIFALDRGSGAVVGEYQVYNPNGKANKSHLSGIAVDRGYLYMTCGGSKIGYAYIAAYLLNRSGSTEKMTLENTIDLSSYIGGADLSYISFNDDVLWTGNYYNTAKAYNTKASSKNNSLILGYDFSSVNQYYYGNPGELISGAPDYTLKIPNTIKNIQCATVRSGKLYLNCSYGRTAKTTMYIGDIKPASSVTVKKANLKSVSMLPMGEGFCFVGNYMYYMQESAAYGYRNGDGNGKSKNPSDVVWKTKVSTLISAAK